jgi:hypothetical protein
MFLTKKQIIPTGQGRGRAIKYFIPMRCKSPKNI